MREHVHLVGGLYRRIVIVQIDVMRNADVIAVIKEVNAIQGHSGTLARLTSNCLDLDQRPGSALMDAPFRCGALLSFRCGPRPSGHPYRRINRPLKSLPAIRPKLNFCGWLLRFSHV